MKYPDKAQFEKQMYLVKAIQTQHMLCILKVIHFKPVIKTR